MIRIRRTVLVSIAVIGLFAAPAFASNFPNIQETQARPQPRQVQPQQQERFYGYVPPPPIRHTWPGGYRNIFHELTNSLIEHMLGQY